MNIEGEEVDHKYLPEAVPGEKVGFNFKDIPIKDIKRGYITSGVADFTFAPVNLCTEIKSMEKNNESLIEAVPGDIGFTVKLVSVKGINRGYVRETERISKSFPAIINVTPKKMDIFILAVKELNLTTLPHLQLLINSIINQAYQVKLVGLFASFCKKLTEGC